MDVEAAGTRPRVTAENLQVSQRCTPPPSISWTDAVPEGVPDWYAGHPAYACSTRLSPFWETG